MVDTKTLLKAGGLLVVAFVLVSVLWTLVSLLFGAVAFIIELAIQLLVVAIVLYGLYWAYTTFISDSKSTSRSREKVFER